MRRFIALILFLGTMPLLGCSERDVPPSGPQTPSTESVARGLAFTGVPRAVTFLGDVGDNIEVQVIGDHGEAIEWQGTVEVSVEGPDGLEIESFVLEARQGRASFSGVPIRWLFDVIRLHARLEGFRAETGDIEIVVPSTVLPKFIQSSAIFLTGCVSDFPAWTLEGAEGVDVVMTPEYRSSDHEVVRVTDEGLIACESPGTAEMSIHLAGMSARLPVTVLPEGGPVSLYSEGHAGLGELFYVDIQLDQAGAAGWLIGFDLDDSVKAMSIEGEAGTRCFGSTDGQSGRGRVVVLPMRGTHGFGICRIALRLDPLAVGDAFQVSVLLLEASDSDGIRLETAEEPVRLMIAPVE